MFLFFFQDLCAKEKYKKQGKKKDVVAKVVHICVDSFINGKIILYWHIFFPVISQLYLVLLTTFQHVILWSFVFYN